MREKQKYQKMKTELIIKYNKNLIKYTYFYYNFSKYFFTFYFLSYFNYVPLFLFLEKITNPTYIEHIYYNIIILNIINVNIKNNYYLKQILVLYSVINIIIFIEKKKNIINSMRFKKIVVRFNKFNIWQKNLIVRLKNLSGRNLNGKKVLRTKCNNSNRFYVPISSLRLNSIGLIVGIFYCSLYQQFFFLIKTNSNIYFYIKSISGLFIGDYIYKFNYFSGQKYFQNGTQTLLGLCKSTNLISNITISSNLKIKRIATASGTYCYVYKNSLETNLSKIKLPSGKTSIISCLAKVVIGRNGFINKKYQFFSKAGYIKNLGINQTVRGVAMNPVDHPHGGRTKTNSPEVSIWGWVTKHSH